MSSEFEQALAQVREADRLERQRDAMALRGAADDLDRSFGDMLDGFAEIAVNTDRRLFDLVEGARQALARTTKAMRELANRREA